MLRLILQKNLYLFSSPKPNYLEEWSDHFNNRHFKINAKVSSQDSCINYISQSIPPQNLSSSQKNKYPTAIWVHLDKNNFDFLGILCSGQMNFNIHHAVGNNIVLYKWLDNSMEDMVAPYSMFIVSCGALVINEKNEVLLVQEKIGGRAGKYGLPGGRADLGQPIQRCVQRQLREETGIEAKYEYLFYLRETNNTADGALDLYFVCYVKYEQGALQKIKICDKQLKDYKWVHLVDLQKFLGENGVKTQQAAGKYLTSCYNKGFNFKNDLPNKTLPYIYTSPRDKITRQFIQHMLI